VEQTLYSQRLLLLEVVEVVLLVLLLVLRVVLVVELLEAELISVLVTHLQQVLLKVIMADRAGREAEEISLLLEVEVVLEL
jgi:hypothetical protein